MKEMALSTVALFGFLIAVELFEIAAMVLVALACRLFSRGLR